MKRPDDIASRGLLAIAFIGLSDDIRDYALELVRQNYYRDFGPTFAAEVLLDRHGVKHIGRGVLERQTQRMRIHELDIAGQISRRANLQSAISTRHLIELSVARDVICPRSGSPPSA